MTEVAFEVYCEGVAMKYLEEIIIEVMDEVILEVIISFELSNYKFFS